MKKSEIEGKMVEGTDIEGRLIDGKVLLVFTDALASGTNEYVPVTYLSVQDKVNSCVYTIRPRDLIKIKE